MLVISRVYEPEDGENVNTVGERSALFDFEEGSGGAFVLMSSSWNVMRRVTRPCSWTGPYGFLSLFSDELRSENWLSKQMSKSCQWL